jgi:hypothetical protein
MAEESPVQPGVEATHPMNGSWRIDTADSTLRKNLDAAIESVAKEFNLLFRDLVRQKLSGATKLCATYTLNVQAEAVHFSCDDRPSVTLQRDGSPFHTLNEAGEPVRGTVEVQGHTVRVSWKGEAGGRTNEFSLKEDTLVLTAKVRSDRIPTPLSWTVDYKK